MPDNTYALQYYRRGFFLEVLNPLVKFIIIISLSLLLFISDSVWLHGCIFILCVLGFILSPFSFFKLQGARILLITTLFIGLLQVVFGPTGNTFASTGMFNPANPGFLKAISAMARFISVILLSYLFVLTTEPGGFVHSLVQVGLPYRFGYALITALRMVPMVRREVRKIIFAQTMRGVKYRLFPLKELFINVNRFTRVVLISTLKRVNQLVISMEGRSFGLYPDRTTLSTVTFRWFDYVLLLFALGLIPLTILWR